VVPATQEEATGRTPCPAAVDSKARWTRYGFVQGNDWATGNRKDNGRVGAGGSCV